MNNKHAAILLTSCLFMPIASTAASITSMSPACISEKHLDEATRTFVNDNMAAFYDLVKRGKCTILTTGQQVSIIKMGLEVSVVKVDGVKLHTLSHALR